MSSYMYVCFHDHLRFLFYLIECLTFLLSGQPIFNRDLRWCPTFSKLKTLLLNDWCVVIDLHALVCILKHSPILEKLTIQLAKVYLSKTTVAVFCIIKMSLCMIDLSLRMPLFFFFLNWRMPLLCMTG